MPQSSQLAAVAVLAGSALAIAGCGSDSSDDDSGSATTVNGCEIAPGTQCQDADLSGVTLDGEDANGGDFTAAEFSDSELTGVNATGSEFEIDGQAPGAQAGFGGSGAANFDLPCDGEDQTISLTVLNAEGETATEAREVQT